MTDRNLIDSEVLEEKATAWINEVVPGIYLALDKAGIMYSEDLLCESLADGFKVGYATCWKEIKGTESVPS
jgi:hypothetical protein